MQAFATIPNAVEYTMVARGVFKEDTHFRRQPMEPEARSAAGTGGPPRRHSALTEAQKQFIRTAMNEYLKPYFVA